MKKESIAVALAAGIALLAGCAKEVSEETAAEPELITLSATFPESSTKAAIDENDNTKIVWEEGDGIKVFSDTGDYDCFTLIEGAGTSKGVFQGVKLEGTPCYAVYPDHMEFNLDEEDKIQGSIYLEQTVHPGTFGKYSGLYMVGALYDDSIIFQHTCAFLKVIAPEDVDNLEYITIWPNSRNATFGGWTSFDPNSGEATGRTGGHKDKALHIMPGDDGFVAGKPYYASVLPFKDAISITYTYIDKTTHKAATFTKRGTEILDAELGHVCTIGTFDLRDEDVEVHTGTQLRLNGPIYADFNIGSTVTDRFHPVDDPTANFGGLYAWNNPDRNARKESEAWTQAQISSHTMKYGVEDVASAIWGYGWEEPSINELKDLGSGDYKWTYFDKDNPYTENWKSTGYKVVCTDEYGWESNEVFFDCTGEYDYSEEKINDSVCQYWSGTMEVSFPEGAPLFVNSLNLSKDEFGKVKLLYNNSLDSAYMGYGVRAVLWQFLPN